MERWRNLQSSFHQQFDEDKLLGSVIEFLVQKDTVEKSHCDFQQCGIHFRQLNESGHETSSTPSQFNKSCLQTSSTPSKQHTSESPSYDNYVSADQNSTAIKVLNTCATPQQQLQHTFCVAEIPGTKRLQELADQLGNEKLELLLQIFGTCSQEQ